jgi:hypothetical protein
MKTLLIFADEIKESSLPSQRTIQNKNIKKKLKPGINNNYLLLWHVKYITMIDWKNANGFSNLPLVTNDLDYDIPKDNIGEWKLLGPLFHYAGLLPYIMKNSHKYPTCALRDKYKQYPPAHPGHMHSHVPMNVETYIAKREGRINVLILCILQNLAF